jgi:hypothetical protein
MAGSVEKGKFFLMHEGLFPKDIITFPWIANGFVAFGSFQWRRRFQRPR